MSVESLTQKLEKVNLAKGGDGRCAWLIVSFLEGDYERIVLTFPPSFFGTVLPPLEEFAQNVDSFNNTCGRYVNALYQNGIKRQPDVEDTHIHNIVLQCWTIDAAGIMIRERCNRRRSLHENMLLEYKIAANPAALLGATHEFLRSCFLTVADADGLTHVSCAGRPLFELSRSGVINFANPGKPLKQVVVNLYRIPYDKCIAMLMNMRRAYKDKDEMETISERACDMDL